MSPSLAKILEHANALRVSGRPQDALIVLNNARQNENAPALWLAMGQVFDALHMGAGTEQVFLEGLKHHPEDAALRLQLANHYYRADRAADGLRIIEPLVEKNPAPEILLTYASLLKAAEKTAEARACFEKILSDTPRNVAALANLADMYLDDRDYQKATRLFEQAHALDKTNTHVSSKLAQVYFRTGELEKAWSFYEARFGLSPNDPFATAQRRPYEQPLWQGEKLEPGKTLLLYGEQGIGEEILHASMLPDALTCAESIIVECGARLVPLFERSFPNILFITRDDAPHADASIAAQAPLGHLGFLFRKEFEAFPKRASYLKADAQKTTALRAKYEALANGGTLVGISWKSKKLRHGDPKSISLEEWKPVFEMGNTLFIDLQYGASSEELAFAAQRGWRLHHDSAVDQQASLEDYAAQIAALDGVITVSNTAAHMAGALGVKTAVLLPDSRGLMGHWFDNRHDSPWYPSLTLLRQTNDGEWKDVMERATAFLKTL